MAWKEAARGLLYSGPSRAWELETAVMPSANREFLRVGMHPDERILDMDLQQVQPGPVAIASLALPCSLTRGWPGILVEEASESSCVAYTPGDDMTQAADALLVLLAKLARVGNWSIMPQSAPIECKNSTGMRLRTDTAAIATGSGL